jgi:hypothetical protein
MESGHRSPEIAVQWLHRKSEHQQAANARRAHFSEGDLLAALVVGHGPMIAPTGPRVKPLDIGPSPAGRTMERTMNVRFRGDCVAKLFLR